MPQKLIQHSLGFSRESRMDSIMRSSKSIMFNTRTKNKQLSNLLDFEMKKLDSNENLVLLQTNRSVNNERNCLSKMLALRKVYQRHSFDKYDPVLHPQKRNRLCHLDARDLMKMWFKGKTVKIDKTESDIQSQTDSRPASSVFRRMRMPSGRSRKLSSVSGEGGVWGNIITETIHEEPKGDTDSLLDENTEEAVVYRLDDENMHIAPIQSNNNQFSGKDKTVLDQSETTDLKMQTSEQINDISDKILENMQTKEDHNETNVTKHGTEVNNLDQKSSEDDKLSGNKSLPLNDSKLTDVDIQVEEELNLKDSRVASDTKKPPTSEVGENGQKNSLTQNVQKNTRVNETSSTTQENTLKSENNQSTSVKPDQSDMKESVNLDEPDGGPPNIPVNAKELEVNAKELEVNAKELEVNAKELEVQNKNEKDSPRVHSEKQTQMKIEIMKSSTADNNEKSKLKENTKNGQTDTPDTKSIDPSVDVKTKKGVHSGSVDDQKNIKIEQPPKVLHQRQSSSKSNVSRDIKGPPENHSEPNKTETNSRNTLSRKQINNRTLKSSENVRTGSQKLNGVHTHFVREKTNSGRIRTSGNEHHLRNNFVKNEGGHKPQKEIISASSSTLIKQQQISTKTINKLQPSTAPSILKRNKTDIESWMSSVNRDTRRSSSASTLKIDRTVVQNASTNNPTNWKGLIHKLRGQHTEAIVDDRVIAAKSTRRLKRREKTFVLSRERTIFPGQCKSTYEMRKFMDQEVSNLIFSLSPKGRRQNQIELLKEREKLPVFVDKSKTTSAILRDYRKYREITRTFTAP